MKKVKLLILLLTVLILCFLAYQKNSDRKRIDAVIYKQLPKSQDAVAEDHEIIPILVGEKELSVEAVTSIESITLGLGNRTEIGSDGMLFFMPRRDIVSFWMHGMQFPLDLVWMDGSKVVGVIKNVPAPQDPGSFELPSYSSEVAVTEVLELPAGKADELGIKKDDRVVVFPNLVIE